MNKFLILLFFILSLFSCNSPKTETINLFDLVSEEASYIIESDDMKSLLENIQNNTELKEIEFFQNLNSKKINSYLSLATPHNSILYFVKKDSANFDFLLLTKPEKDSILKTSEDFSVETITTKDFSYKKTRIGESNFYSALKSEVLITSSSLKLLEELVNTRISEIKKSENFKKAIAARSIGKSSFFIHHKNAKNSVADWSVLDLEINKTNFSFNGIALTKEEPKQLLNIFKGLQHQKQELSHVVPNTATGFYSFTYNDFQMLSKNLQKYRNDSIKTVKTSLFNYTKEAGAIFIANETAVAVNLFDKELALENFPLIDDLQTEFRGIKIYSAPKMEFLKAFEPLLPFKSFKFYMLLENFLIYAENQETLEQIISNFQNNSTLAKNATFRRIQENLADASSLLIFTKPQLSNAQIANSVVLDNMSLISKLDKNYSLAATQFVSNDTFTHIHGMVVGENDEENEKVEDLVTTTFPIKSSEKTFIITNSNKVTFAIQDENNSLSYLDEAGKTLWSKKLETQIIGAIHQVNLSNNGEVHLAFTTLNKFHLLDSNGRYTKGFPLEFKDDVTQPVSVFDYDNNMKYRFVIVQENELLMYNAKAELVKGFGFSKASSEITQPPKHIRLKNKDYIVFPEKSGKLNILSRQGKERIKLNEHFQFSDSFWYENKNNFISISEDGKLLRIDENGKVTKQDLKTVANLQLVANENALVYLSENELSINATQLTLDFGLYTQPQIFTFSGKTFVSIVDTQAKKVYLFNEKGELAPNFPVYGTSVLELTTSKIKNRSSLFVLGESGEIINYQF